jgi:hypothetical protein
MLVDWIVLCTLGRLLSRTYLAIPTAGGARKPEEGGRIAFNMLTLKGRRSSLLIVWSGRPTRGMKSVLFSIGDRRITILRRDASRRFIFRSSDLLLTPVFLSTKKQAVLRQFYATPLNQEVSVF